MALAYIFDMDGVIIDSEPIHFEVDIETMEHYGLSITHEQLERFVGMTNPEMWAILKQEYPLTDTVEEIIEVQLASKISKLRASNLTPIDGIAQLLHELNRSNIPIGLASSSPRRFITEVLSKFQIERYFQAVVSGEEVDKGKPAPDVYYEAARQLGVAPESCVVIEDSRNGIRAAKAAGMKCIGFVNENSGNQDLSAADRIVTSIREINPIDGF